MIGANFCQALVALKAGGRVRREAWPENATLVLFRGEHLCIRPRDVVDRANEDIGWRATSADLLAEDWEIL